jgi:glycosyltransferase involved in cell wall biosynthesis
MKVIVYESSSKGGCYEYAQYLVRCFIQKGYSSLFVLPQNSRLRFEECLKESVFILSDDKRIHQSKLFSKLDFLFRQFFNPFRFLLFLLRKEPSLVIWNDFEQLTAPFWTIVFRLFAGRHYHVIILHDPDRDQYPPSKSYSEWCMELIMNKMDLALYHGYLPIKKYYTGTKTMYQSVVHGIYDKKEKDRVLTDYLKQQKKNTCLIGILGNIREEKNYRLIIEALALLPAFKLLIAGAPSNSSMDIDELKRLAVDMGVEDRIIWYVKYLTEEELASCIAATDIVALYYQRQFTSQSGILNLLAPYKKDFIYSDTPSGLSEVCKKYTIGYASPTDSKKGFVATVQSWTQRIQETQSGWNAYLQEADWLKTIEIITAAYHSTH